MTHSSLASSKVPALKWIIISPLKLDVIAPALGRICVSPAQFIAEDFGPHARVNRRTRVINLSHDYGYLTTSYYCSLLADARGVRCLPTVSSVIHATWKRLHSDSFAALELALNEADCAAATVGRVEIVSYFGRADHPDLQGFTRKVFDAFRLPAMKISLAHKNGRLHIRDIDSVSLAHIEADSAAFNESLNEFSGHAWGEDNNAQVAPKYWLAILYDPQEVYPPSNKRALQNFIRVGRKMGFYVELITKANIDSLLEFDALFIRETTAVNDHTYRFAQKAAREDMVVIDDPQSILRCCNKVYLQEMLKKHNIPTPGAQFLYRRQKAMPLIDPAGFPKVLKVPDGSFSRGVYKVTSQADLESRAAEMFKKSEIILLQDFVKSDFDWRIVVIGGTPLFACKYFMARGHWQIYNHASSAANKGDADTGDAVCVPIADVPDFVIDTALKACAVIGDGLYGADIKEIDGQAVVIEINDNPNIDAGVEDQILKDTLYQTVLEHFKTRIDRR
ncbi:RimK family protein [Fretibacter rubidus]|uniref:RimK family protein n=1 Tax=Fretibacter rubidus TaxID=570162 RepID=UPI00352A4E9A